MTLPLAIRRVLLSLLRRHGGFPVVAFDVDEFLRYEENVGSDAAASALVTLRDIFAAKARTVNGEVHVLQRDRFLVTLPTSTYDEAVSVAEQLVDDVRERRIVFANAGAPSKQLSVTAAVIAVDASNVERFSTVVSELLLDGKSTGGDAIIRRSLDRPGPR